MGSRNLGVNGRDQGWSWREAAGRLQTSQKQYLGFSGPSSNTQPEADTESSLRNGRATGLQEVSTETVEGQSSDPRVIKPISVLSSLKPRREGVRKGQEPWPCPTGFKMTAFLARGEEEEFSLNYVQAVRPWTSHLVPPILHLPICKRGRWQHFSCGVLVTTQWKERAEQTKALHTACYDY